MSRNLFNLMTKRQQDISFIMVQFVFLHNLLNGKVPYCTKQPPAEPSC